MKEPVSLLKIQFSFAYRNVLAAKDAEIEALKQQFELFRARANEIILGQPYVSVVAVEWNESDGYYAKAGSGDSSTYTIVFFFA